MTDPRVDAHFYHSLKDARLTIRKVYLRNIRLIQSKERTDVTMDKMDKIDIFKAPRH